MLNKTAFANSLALLIVAFYVLYYVLLLVARPLFDFLLNAEFFGGDLASLVPAQVQLVSVLGTLVTMAVLGWVMGYGWAWLYNKFAK